MHLNRDLTVNKRFLSHASLIKFLKALYTFSIFSCVLHVIRFLFYLMKSLESLEKKIMASSILSHYRMVEVFCRLL